MNQIGSKFLLAGDKFMAKMHLRQPGFTYGACGSFTKNKRNSKFTIYLSKRTRQNLLLK